MHCKDLIIHEEEIMLKNKYGEWNEMSEGLPMPEPDRKIEMYFPNYDKLLWGRTILLPVENKGLCLIPDISVSNILIYNAYDFNYIKNLLGNKAYWRYMDLLEEL